MTCEPRFAELVGSIGRRAIDEVVHNDDVLLRREVGQRVRQNPWKGLGVEAGFCRHEGRGRPVGSDSTINEDIDDTFRSSLKYSKSANSEGPSRTVWTDLTLQNSEIITRLTASIHTLKVIDDSRRIERCIRPIGVRIIFGVVLDENEPRVG